MMMHSQIGFLRRVRLFRSENRPRSDAGAWRPVIRRISSLLLALLVSWGSGALAGGGGSLYSIGGIGDIRYSPNVRGIGMGYTGIGIPGANYINSIAPATWSRINRTRMDAGFLSEGFQTTDGIVSRYLARADFAGAMLAIPISQQHGIVLGAGFTPYSRVSYDNYANGAHPSPTDTLNYALHQVGSGGLNKGQIGLSYLLLPNLAIGAGVGYIFGTIDKSVIQIPTSTAHSGGTINESTTYTGVSYTFSALFTGLGDIAEPLRPLTLGFVVNTRANLHTVAQSTYNFASEYDTSSETRGRTVAPFSYGIGLAYQAGERYILAADYFAQPWTLTEMGGRTPDNIRDSYRFGIGAERLPLRDINALWYDKWSYRLGFSYNATYYQFNGQPINEWVATCGLAFPFSGDARVSVAFEYGGRGNTNNGLVKDNIYRISVSLNFSELWFTRYEED